MRARRKERKGERRAASGFERGHVSVVSGMRMGARTRGCVRAGVKVRARVRARTRVRLSARMRRHGGGNSPLIEGCGCWLRRRRDT